MWNDVILNDPDMKPVSARVYRNGDTQNVDAFVLHFHGGAFADRQSGVDRPIAMSIALCGTTVFSADYGAAADNSFPHTMDVAFDVLRHLSAMRKGSSRRIKLIVAGEEAGGNVAAAVALRARDQMPGELDGQILLSPLLDHSMSSVSMREAGSLGMRQSWAAGWARYLGLDGDPSHPYAAPASCTRFANLADALIVTSENDPLRDETLTYAARLQSAGVAVTQHVLSAGTGWPSIYGGKGQEHPDWSSDLSQLFGRFVQELTIRPS